MRAGALWLVRHGETAWSRDRLHTSVTDVPLTEAGMKAAGLLGDRLSGHGFRLVLTSPRLRARHSAQLAGYPDADVDDDLVEWDYGRYEGISTARIRETEPGWSIWSHPAPGGETAGQVQQRPRDIEPHDRAAATYGLPQHQARLAGAAADIDYALTRRWSQHFHRV